MTSKTSSKELYFASVAKIVVTFRSNHAGTMKTLNVCFGNTELLRTSRSENMPSDLPAWPLAVPRAGHVAVALAVKEKMVKVYSGRAPPGENHGKTTVKQVHSSPLKSYLPK